MKLTLSDEKDLRMAEIRRAQEQAPESKFADTLASLKAAKGYLLNAKIDLQTGAPKRTALNTIDGGLKMIDAAIEKAEAA